MRRPNFLGRQMDGCSSSCLDILACRKKNALPAMLANCNAVRRGGASPNNGSIIPNRGREVKTELRIENEELTRDLLMPNGVRRYGAVRPEQIRVFPNRLPRHSDRHGGQPSHADADASWMRPIIPTRLRGRCGLRARQSTPRVKSPNALDARDGNPARLLL